MARATFRLPLPHAGMNADASLTALDRNEAAWLQNFITNEPGQLRQRRPIRLISKHTTLLNTYLGDQAFGTATVGSKVLSGWMDEDDWDTFNSITTRRSHADAISTTAPTSTFGIIENVGTASPVKITAASVRDSLPIGPTVGYDGSAYGVSVDCDPQDTLYPNWSTSAMLATSSSGGSDVSLPATRLVRWGGSSEVATVAATVTLNNGATTGTFGGTPPANSMVGMFLIDRATSGTGRAPSFGFSYTYRITAHVAGAASFTIDRPFGIGATAAQVPNLAAASCTLWPIAQIPMAPPEIAHVALHKDRLFVGQVFSSVKASGVPAGRSVNAVAWCDIGEPNKWSSTNIIAVDDRSDEAITGLASVGNGSVLLIFKPTRTYALFGDTEDNFEARLLNGSHGCIDAGGIVEYQGGIGFPSERGYMYFDGVSFRNLTSPQPGHGIGSLYFESINVVNRKVATTSTRPRHVTATTVQDYLVMAPVPPDKLGPGSTARPVLLYHFPTRAWSTIQSSALTSYTGRLIFGRVGSLPEVVGFFGQDGGFYRLDYALSPGTVIDATSGTGFHDIEEASQWDELINSSSGATTDDTIGATWVTGIQMPYDGDDFKVVDGTLEFLLYGGPSDTDLATTNPTSTSAGGIVVHLRPDLIMAGTRTGGMFPSGGTNYDDGATLATHAVPTFTVNPRAGSTDPRIDQRVMTQKLVVSDDGLFSLPMGCRSFQMGFLVNSVNAAARIYGVRLAIDGPTIQPGYDK